MPGVKISLTEEESGSPWVALSWHPAILGGITATLPPGPCHTGWPTVA